MNHQDQQAPANGSPRPARLWAKLHAGRAGGGKPQSGTALATLIALTLAACGGGGGGGSSSGSNGGSSTPSCATGQVLSGGLCVTPVDAALTVAVTPADGASAVKRDAAVVTAVPTVTAGSFSTHTSTGLVCNGTTIVAGDKAVLTGQTLTLTPTAALLPGYGDTCVAQGQVVANGKDTGKQTTVAWKTTFTIEKEPAWWPPTVTPKGVKVLQSELKQLPAGCLSFTDTCFKNFVASGKAKVVATDQTMVGLASPNDKRSIVTVGFITPSGKPQLTMFYADTGEPAVTDKIDVNINDPFDWVTGNEQGYLWKRTSNGVCYQWKWYYSISGSSGLFWSNEIVTCPS
jgi:hypothetical protein